MQAARGMAVLERVGGALHAVQLRAKEWKKIWLCVLVVCMHGCKGWFSLLFVFVFLAGLYIRLCYSYVSSFACWLANYLMYT